MSNRIARTGNLRTLHIENDYKIVRLNSMAPFEDMECPGTRPEAVETPDRQYGAVIDRDFRIETFRLRKGRIKCEGVVDNLSLRDDFNVVRIAAQQ